MLRSSTVLIGERFGFKKSGLSLNKTKNITINVTDTLGKKFVNTKNVMTDEHGMLDISPFDCQAMISAARESQKSAFILKELDAYNIDITDDDGEINDRIIIDSGIGTVICKEEWRDDIVGNLFYPSSGVAHKVILHINGSVPLLQDAR